MISKDRAGIYFLAGRENVVGMKIKSAFKERNGRVYEGRVLEVTYDFSRHEFIFLVEWFGGDYKITKRSAGCCESLNPCSKITGKNSVVGRRVKSIYKMDKGDDKTFEGTIIAFAYDISEQEYMFLVHWDDNDLTTRQTNKCQFIDSGKKGMVG